jgi:FtsH-binding integral membrane protein
MEPLDRTLRNIVVGVILVALGVAMCLIDYRNPSWQANEACYRSMLILGCTLAAVVCCMVYESRWRKKSDL